MVGKQCGVSTATAQPVSLCLSLRYQIKYGLTFAGLKSMMHAHNEVSDAAGPSLDLSKKKSARRRSTSQPPIRSEILSDHVQIIPINIQPDTNSTKKNLKHEPSISRILINSAKPIIPDKPKNLQFLKKRLQEAKHPAPLISQSKWVKSMFSIVHLTQMICLRLEDFLITYLPMRSLSMMFNLKF